MKRKDHSRLNKDAPIAIVGCGIAGLSTAISLTQVGFSNLVLIERDASPASRREGFGMTLTYNPKGPLAQLGLLEEVAQADCPSRSHYVFAPDGSILGYYGNAFSKSMRGIGQRGNLRVPRQKLREILLQKFQQLVKQQNAQSQVLWGHSILDLCEVDIQGEVQVELKLQTNSHSNNGETSSQKICSKNVSLLIAADGVHSSVVSKLAPNSKPQPLNVGIILGISENYNQHTLLDERGFYTIDGKRRLFIMPYEGDQYASVRRTMWQLSYRCDQEEKEDSAVLRNPEFLRDKVMEICSSWHHPVTSMVQATPLGTIWGT
jgi:2-polyprenyl-6-methoxyphenol hydroxylase-like FAD-dependent oxidoreductase